MADEKAAGDAESGGRAVVLVDPDPVSRNLGEDLEDDLERPVFALDSMDFIPESSEEVMEADAYIVCWDLGIRCGLDLIEEIRRTPLIADRVVLVAAKDPTRSLVRRALLAGAEGVCCLPYDGPEVALRLAAAQARREQDAA